jgi:hypothetical protein
MNYLSKESSVFILGTDITSLIDTNSTYMKLYFDEINFDTK